jgi:hypothetical protein
MPNHLRQFADIRRKTIRNRYSTRAIHHSLLIDRKPDNHLIPNCNQTWQIDSAK